MEKVDARQKADVQIGEVIQRSNFGFISKKRIAREIANVYHLHDNTPCEKEQFLRDCEAQSALNFLCKKLNIKPMHLNKLGGGTGEMLKKRRDKEWKV